MVKKKISFVIPLFNESESINELYQQIKEVLAADLNKYYGEIIFVDDGSKDSSLEVIKNLRSKDFRIEIISFRRNLGKSAALNQGFKKASGDIVVTLDADLQDDPQNLPRMIKVLNENYDLVVGWKKERNDPFSKVISSKMFNFFVRNFSQIPLHDFNSGKRDFKYLGKWD